MRPFRAIAIVGFSACLDPTQVTLELHTDICDLKRVTIYFEGQQDAPIASFDPKGVCPRDLGSLVFVPSDRGDKFTIVVEGTSAADGKCDPLQCVKTSRTVSYVKHSSLVLPIDLEKTCVGVSCLSGKTCVHGKCVNPDVVCGAIKRLCDIGDDAGLVPDDSGITPLCVTGASGKIVPGTPLHHWTFDELTGPYMDGVGTSPVTLAAGFTQVVPGKCGAAVGFPTSSLTMPLGTAVATKGVGVVADLRVSMTTAAFTFMSAARQGSTGWRISGQPDAAGSYSLQFTVLVQTMNVGVAISTTKIPMDSTWHHIEVLGWGSIVHFLVDNGMPESLALTGGGMIPTGMLPLELLGSTAPVAIDNLWIYSGQ